MTTDNEDNSLVENVTTGAFDNLPPAAAADSSPEEYVRLWKWKEKNKRSRQSDDILHESWATAFASMDELVRRTPQGMQSKRA